MNCDEVKLCDQIKQDEISLFPYSLAANIETILPQIKLKVAAFVLKLRLYTDNIGSQTGHSE